MKVLAALLVLLTLLAAIPMAQGQSGGGNRRDDELTVPTGPPLDAAISASFGTIIAGGPDPAGTEDIVLPQPGGTSWVVWSSQGQALHQGNGEVEECDQRLDCSMPSNAVAIASGGYVFAVASAVGPAPLLVEPSPVRSTLLLGNLDVGVTHRLDWPNRILAMDLSAAGDRIGILDCEVDQQDECGAGRVGLYKLSSTGLTQPAVYLAEYDDVPSALDVSEDGLRLVIAADNYRRVKDDGMAAPTATTDADTTSITTAVEVAEGPARLTVAGLRSGKVALYSDAGVIFKRSPGSSPIVDVALRPGLPGKDPTSYVALDAAGNLHQFAIDKPTATTFQGRLVRTTAFGSSGTGLAYSGDGNYLLVTGTGKAVEYRVGDSSLTQLFSEPIGGATDPGFSANADVAIVRGEDGVVVLDALHEVRPEGPSALTVAPDSSRNVTFRVHNVGNRPEAVAVTTDYPPGFFFSANPATFSLEPGTSKEVQGLVVVPKGALPGVHTVYVNATASGATSSASMELEVPEVRLVTLIEKPPVSRAVPAGGAAEFRAILSNDGNVRGGATIEASVQPDTWKVELGSYPTELEPGKQVEVLVKLVAPATAEDGDQGQATLRLADTPGLPVRFTAQVGARFGIQLLGPVGVAVDPGADNRFDLGIHNDGNVADTFELRITPQARPPGWSVGFANGQEVLQSGQVEPGESAFLTVTVRVPAEAALESVLQLDAVATSLGDPTQHDSRTVQLTVGGNGTLDPEGGGGGKDSPGVGALVLPALAAAAVLARRRGA